MKSGGLKLKRLQNLPARLDVLGNDLTKNAEAARETMREEFKALQELMEAKKQQLEAAQLFLRRQSALSSQLK